MPGSLCLGPWHVTVPPPLAPGGLFLLASGIFLASNSSFVRGLRCLRLPVVDLLDIRNCMIILQWWLAMFMFSSFPLHSFLVLMSGTLVKEVLTSLQGAPSMDCSIRRLVRPSCPPNW